MANLTVDINLDAEFEEGKHPRGKGGKFTFHSSLTGNEYQAPEKAKTRSAAHNQGAILSRRKGEEITVKHNGNTIAKFLKGYALWTKP